MENNQPMLNKQQRVIPHDTPPITAVFIILLLAKFGAAKFMSSSEQQRNNQAI